jgi:hypothetical protein
MIKFATILSVSVLTSLRSYGYFDVGLGRLAVRFYFFDCHGCLGTQRLLGPLLRPIARAVWLLELLELERLELQWIAA